MRPISLSRLPPITCRSSSVKCPHFSRTCPLYCFHFPSNCSKFIDGLPLCDRIRTRSPPPAASDDRVGTSVADQRNGLANAGANLHVEPRERRPPLRWPAARAQGPPATV